MDDFLSASAVSTENAKIAKKQGALHHCKVTFHHLYVYIGPKKLQIIFPGRHESPYEMLELSFDGDNESSASVLPIEL